MSKSKILTKAIAEQYLKNRSVSLSLFTSIEDAAAQALAKHRGYLSLGGLESLNDTTAQALEIGRAHV